MMTEAASPPVPERRSQRRLVLYLSGRWDARCARAVEPHDLLFCAPGFAARAPKLNWTELPRVPRTCLPDLAREYAAAVFGKDMDPCGQSDFTLANTQFEYGISPIAAQLEAIENILNLEGVVQVLVIASETKLNRVPASGIVTKESTRGSADLIGALVARSITAGLSIASLERIVTRGDALSKSVLRSLCLRGAAIALSILNAIRMISSPMSSSSQADPMSDLLVVVRSPGQSLHAARLFKGVPNVAMMVIPQFTSSNCLRVITDRVDQDRRYLKPANRDIFRALLTAVFRPRLSSNNDDSREVSLEIGRFKITTSRRDLVRELQLLPVITFHKLLLEYSIRRFSKIKKIIGFEIKGGFAAAEAMAGRTQSIETATVQTVLVPPRALPVFPWSDVFYADSRSSMNQILNIGQRGTGRVVFSGNPHEKALFTPLFKLKEVLFLSQPYELDQARTLLSALVVQARSDQFKIRIRLHPRDSSDNYSALLAASSDCLSVSGRETLHADIATADLCVTRVSSAAKEALAAGKPIVVCLMSEYDRSIVADYIATDKLASDYIAYNMTDLANLLAVPERVFSAGLTLQERIFDDEHLHDLRMALTE